MLNQLQYYDNQIILFLNSLGGSNSDSFWLFITQALNWVWLLFLAIYLLLKLYGFKKGLQLFLSVLFVGLAALIIVHFIKIGIGRIRPNNNLEIVHLLRLPIKPQTYSFVSGHATFSTAVAIQLYKILKNKIRYTWLIFIFPILFSYSRLHLGVHYLSDILFGVLLGLLIGNLGWLITKKVVFKD
ncbi:phosphatase PAP2 family protein [Tenacibaculum sp. UWU-22]|uniref:phosphatase PAP2 family protein n=1 Tax=Tenacibaculum sp. UWU-22 TaxID=3234187 RepID=UPI0034DABE7F